MNPRRPPTPAEIADAPELAILAALSDTLDLALRALVAAHPQLGDPDCPAWIRQAGPDSVAADVILTAATHLSDALDAYRRVLSLRRDSDPDTDLPF